MKLISLSLLWIFQSCASYNYAQNVKTVAFSDDLSKGKNLGAIRGEDCTWSVLGYKLGGEPTIEQAFSNTRNQSTTLESAGLTLEPGRRGAGIRYVNNVTSEQSGFNAYVVGKQCLVVKGMGFQ